MEAKPPSMVDNFKGLVRSSEDLLKTTLKKSLDNNHQNPRENPVDIMKRLQREGFSELMKLRDRQEKLEKMLLYQKSSPFPGAKTYVKAAFSVIGSLLFSENTNEPADRLERSGTIPGVTSRITFETLIRDRDSLVAEFNSTAGFGSLGLYRLMYHANMNDLFSLVVVPVGAQCCNFMMNSSSSQCHNDDLHASGSPLFHQVHDFAAGVTLRGLKYGASLAHLVSGPSMGNAASNMNNSHFTTFSQITYKPLTDLKIFLSGLWQVHRPSSRLVRISKLTVPLIHLKRSSASEVEIQLFDTDTGTGTPPSVALMAGAEYLKSIKLEGWVEVNEHLNEKLIKYGVSFSDMPENELGWGLRLSGESKGSLLRAQQFQMEGFLNFDLGKRGNAKLQPGLVYVTEGGSRVAALVLRSSWSM